MTPTVVTVNAPTVLDMAYVYQVRLRASDEKKRYGGADCLRLRLLVVLPA